ncbi:MAG: hypothetical protein V7K21_21850, partial [Nostoc sp.]|uniref:hypothetical protein n=1 Tax=Nostoc sp. TaxID=1180 RepID=UPI002FFBC3EA
MEKSKRFTFNQWEECHSLLTDSNGTQLHFLQNALCELSHRMLFKSKNINTKTLAQKNTQSMTG